MIVPSIDLRGGKAVQLIGGKELAIDAGDPRPIARQFGIVGEIAVIDLDGALGTGTNEETIIELLKIADCRVGGGIRSLDAATKWLDLGAKKIILGTAATPELLKQIPKERVIAAVDAMNGKVVVEGWEKQTAFSITEKINELKPYVSGFLVTFVESEGRLKGIDLGKVKEVVAAAAPIRVTVAGGVTTLEELREIHLMGADAQVGMALYTGRMSLGDAVGCLLPEVDLWPTIVCNERREALGFVYSNRESLDVAIKEQRGVYHSRKRGLWRKGETSGQTQELLKVELDCDSDALRFIVKQEGTGFCHLGTQSCWGEISELSKLEKTLLERKNSSPEGSYSGRLLKDSALLNAKIKEEAIELTEASSAVDIRNEAADVIYFTLTKLVSANVKLSEVEDELKRRALKISRRAGDAKSL